ncbi:MAG: response regulator [Hyphomicrobiaceae bacterium]|nr:MAG: response regulator [Hyphomicrobiaceae bacterium]
MARHRTIREPEDAPADVLILCADETARDALAYWLRSSNVATEVAADGYEASERLRSGAFRLLFTDRLLPPWPGLDAFVRLKQRLTNLRIAFIDDGVPDTQALARAAGADVILPRPLRRASVLRATPGFGKEAPCA